MNQRVARIAALAALLSTAIGLSACETTQDKAAALQEQGAALVENQEGVALGAVNKDVEVLSTTVIGDENGSAVAVELKNNSDQPQVNLPIIIDVLDPKGKSVFTNSVPGLDESLTHVPLLLPGETTYWINDQVLATGVAKSVKVKVGESTEKAPSTIPELNAGAPKINEDSSGIEAEGQVSNESQVDQRQLVVYAIATRGGQVVAAGRGQFKNLAAGGKPLRYNIFFRGDPAGAQVEVLAPPSVLE